MSLFDIRYDDAGMVYEDRRRQGSTEDLNGYLGGRPGGHGLGRRGGGPLRSTTADHHRLRGAALVPLHRR